MEALQVAYAEGRLAEEDFERESAARSTRAPPGNSRRRQPGFPARLLVRQGRHEPGRQGSSHVVAVRLAPDARTLSAAAAAQPWTRTGSSPGARRSGLTTGPPQTAARSPAGPGPPRADRPARTGRREPGPGPRRHGPSGPDRPVPGAGPDRTGDRARPDGRTPPDAPRGRTTDRADRTVPGGTGADGQLRPARRSARRRTGPAARSAGHGAGNERGSARRCPPDTARARRGRRAPPAGWLCPVSVACRRRPSPDAASRPRRHPMPGDGAGTLSAFCLLIYFPPR